jgi:hypothetical protein
MLATQMTPVLLALISFNDKPAGDRVWPRLNTNA